MNHIIYIMGVSGSGKTTIGKMLSQKTNIPFFDADNFHSIANKQKMKAGIPLDDDDRREWLQEINKLARQQAGDKGAIIACSALKEKYRNILSGGIQQTIWVFLQGDYQLIYERMKQRQEHYMPAQLLSSQFESLEAPANALVVNIVDKPEAIVEAIYQYISS